MVPVCSFIKCGDFEDWGERDGWIVCYKDKDVGRECLQELLLSFMMFEVVAD